MLDAPAPLDQRTDPVARPLSEQAQQWTLIVACLALSLVMASLVALNTALADIARETSASQTQLTWIVDSYTVVMACLLLPAGAIGDRYGRRGALVLGLAIFAVASVIPLLRSDPGTLIAGRAAAGLGAAFIMPATLSLITAAHPPERRTRAVGIWAGIAGCGGILGMLGSGVLLHFWSWKSIFWGFLGAAVGLAAVGLTIATSKDPESKPIDWRGAAVIAAAVAVFVFGILEAPARGWSDPLVYGCLITGVLLAGAFGVVELRRPHPLLDVRLFADPTFRTGAAAIVVFFVAIFSFLFLAMQYIQLVMGYDALQTAFALTPLAPPMLLLSVLAFWYVPRMGLRLVVLVGLLVVAVGFTSLRVLDVGSGYLDLAWPLLILSAGIGLCTTPTTSAIMSSVPDDKQGVASAVNDTTREVGAALGIALTGSLLASRYTAVMQSPVATLPPEVQRGAQRSLGEALGMADHLGPAGPQLADAARAAFVSAMHDTVLTLGVVVAACAVLIALWAPGRDGRQLAVVRGLRDRRARAAAFLVREG